MPTLEWCFVDELEPGDKVFESLVDDQPDTAHVVEVVALDLIRTPSGLCLWRIHTTGATIRYEVMERVAKLAA